MLTLGRLAGLLVSAGGIYYILQTLTGKVRPERATWFVYMVLGLIALWGQASAGGSDSLWLTVAQNVISTTVFIISIFRGVGGFTKFDLKCLALAGLGLIFWAISRQPIVALLGVVFADAMGSLPTIRKAYKDPESESLISWAMAFVAALLTILSVGELNIALLIYPTYLVSCEALIVSAILLGYRKQR